MKKRILGNVVEADGVSKAVITIEDKRIVDFQRIDPRIAEDVLAIHGADNYGDDCLIFPGYIDIHTHCREDVTGQDNHKEEYRTVGRAALSGGVVYVADMPNNPVVPLDRATYDAKEQLPLDRCPIDVLLYAGIGPDTRPFDRDGEIPYKVFLGPSTRSEDALHFKNYGQLSTTLGRYRGKSVSFHCEDPTLLTIHKDLATHEERRAPICEWSAIDVATDFIEYHGLRGKICHVTTKFGIENILAKKAAGVNVTAEVTPHHLYFDTGMLTEENRHFLRMNPPIRSREDREFLLEMVRQDKFDYLATDHAPHTVAEKMRGISGVPQLDTYGPFVAWLIKEQKVDPVVLFRMACQRPGEWIASFHPERKVGRLLPGYEAHVTVLDLSRPAVEGRPLYTKCNWSPFDLRELPGVVKAVYHHGEKVVDEQYMK